MKGDTSMKFFRIAKYIMLIVLVVFTILLNWGQGFLAKRDIVYSERLVLIKIVMTWLIVPITLVISYGSLMSRKLEDSRAVASVFVSNGIIIFVISAAFVVRLLYFVLFEDYSLHSTYVFGTMTYYEQVNPLMYRRVTRSLRY